MFGIHFGLCGTSWWWLNFHINRFANQGVLTLGILYTSVLNRNLGIQRLIQVLLRYSAIVSLLFSISSALWIFLHLKILSKTKSYSSRRAIENTTNVHTLLLSSLYKYVNISQYLLMLSQKLFHDDQKLSHSHPTSIKTLLPHSHTNNSTSQPTSHLFSLVILVALLAPFGAI